MKLNEDNFNLLVQSVSELSGMIGENQFETKSVSLLCLQMNYGIRFFEKTMVQFSKYVSDHDSSDIKFRDLRAIIDNNLPKDSLISPIVRFQIISGFANDYFSELIPIVNDMQQNIAS